MNGTRSLTPDYVNAGKMASRLIPATCFDARGEYHLHLLCPCDEWRCYTVYEKHMLERHPGLTVLDDPRGRNK